MGEIPVLLKGLEHSTYPGYCGGGHSSGPENLSIYRERVTMRDEEVIREEWLAFDIERHYAWGKDFSISSYAYSMMINGYYPMKRWPFLRKVSHPTVEEFSSTAEQLGGFVLDERITLERNGLHTYRNPARNIFINWNNYHRASSRFGVGKIGIGVIQQEPVSELREVFEEIVPYAIEVFNFLSPGWQISQEVMEASIRVALESNKVIPKCRIQRVS